MSPAASGGRRFKVSLSLLAGLTLLAGTVGASLRLSSQGVDRDLLPEPPPRANLAAEVRTLCSSCHRFPSPEFVPAWAWYSQIENMYELIERTRPSLKLPVRSEVVNWFEDQAPRELPPAQIERATGECPLQFTRVDLPPIPQPADNTNVSNVQLVQLQNEQPGTLLVSEMRAGQILSIRPSDPKPAWKLLARIPNPARTCVVDLDGDGVKDLVVANLGNFLPTDNLCGSVEWLRGKGDGTYYPPVTLLKDVGRVADVRAAHFCGTKKLDLIVAVFGWRDVGEILLLENQTPDKGPLQFEPRVVDRRHGTIHVPVVDLNKDGKPDFVALISQEYETVEAFLNDGKGNFRKETIYTAPDPGYGSSGIQLVDLNGDGKVDVLYTNGDVMDQPHLLKPHHAVRWLENRGEFPFTEHVLAPMYGVHRAVAADLVGTGRPDIVAVSFLPEFAFPQRKEMNLDAVILLEHLARAKKEDPPRFARHTLASVAANHVTCAVGDVWGSGTQDIIVANFTTPGGTTPVTVWRNLGRKPVKPIPAP